jgi:hypothetical protein
MYQLTESLDRHRFSSMGRCCPARIDARQGAHGRPRVIITINLLQLAESFPSLQPDVELAGRWFESGPGTFSAASLIPTSCPANESARSLVRLHRSQERNSTRPPFS